MATFRVRLRREGGREITELPPVCAHCGAEATRSHSTSFWFNWKRQRVTLPLCRKHWLRLKLLPFIRVGYLCVILSLAGGMCWVRVLLQPPEAVETAYSICFYSFVACYVIAMTVLNFRRIRAANITDSYIELTHVALPFVEAVEAEEEALRQRFIRDADEPFVSSPSTDDRIQPGEAGYQPE
jgi:hypothetical protein